MRSLCSSHLPGGGIFILKDYKIHHIGIVVENIETAIKTYETVLGLTVAGIFDVEVFAAKVAFLPVKNTYIELVQPTNPEDGLGRFLQRGGGMHHICYEVEDLDKVYADLKKQGIRSVTGAPQNLPCFEKALFLHPKDTGNVLIELVEKPVCKLPEISNS